MNTQLLCTFTDTDTLEETIKKIKINYDIAFDKLFVLENENNLGELFCTYNIDLDGRNLQLPRTISVHRKKDTNSIYTINALNELIKELNGGELDKTYSVPWENYYNTMLLTSSGELKKIDTDLFTIVDTTKETTF